MPKKIVAAKNNLFAQYFNLLN